MTSDKRRTSAVARISVFRFGSLLNAQRSSGSILSVLLIALRLLLLLLVHALMQ